ncbi:MAG: helicase HerA domain-containing protein [Promethearchaeota archaeon]
MPSKAKPSAEPVAEIIGRTTTATINIRVTELDSVGRNEFLSIIHEGEEYLLLVKELWRQQHETKGTCTVVGSMPRTPFNPDVSVYKASPSIVGEALGIDIPRDEAVYAGLLSGYDQIRVLLPIKKLGRLFIVGKTGSGKSYSAAVIMEEFLEKGIPIVVLDRHGEYSSLKIPAEKGSKRFDVKPKSYEEQVIEFADLTANPGADLPIEAVLGTMPKDLVVSGQGTIINFRGLDLGVQEALSTEILYSLYEAATNREIPPFYCFVDEAHLLAPNRGKAATTKMMRLLAQEGRKFAANLVVITQKPQLLDTHVRSQVGTWIIHQLTDVRDVDITTQSTEGLSREWEDDLQHLEVGQAVIAGDAVKVPLIVDIRIRKTTHGAIGFNPLDFAAPQAAEELERRRSRLRKSFADRMKAAVKRFEELHASIEGGTGRVPQRVAALSEELKAAELKIRELREENKTLKKELDKVQKQKEKAIKLAEEALARLKRSKRR